MTESLSVLGKYSPDTAEEVVCRWTAEAIRLFGGGVGRRIEKQRDKNNLASLLFGEIRGFRLSASCRAGISGADGKPENAGPAAADYLFLIML